MSRARRAPTGIGRALGCAPTGIGRALGRAPTGIGRSQGALLKRLVARKARSYRFGRAQGALLPGFERIRVQIVAREQLVEVGAVAFCKSGGLTDIAHRDLQNL